MFWDDDSDQAKAKDKQKKGRRSSDFTSTTTNKEVELPQQLKRVGGWADEILKGRKGQRYAEPTKPEKIVSSIPIIPDSEDITEITNDVSVVAPKMAINRTETYSQINRDLMRNSLIKTLGNVDFSILTESLSSEEQLKSIFPETTWTFDSLFAELSEDYYKTNSNSN